MFLSASSTAQAPHPQFPPTRPPQGWTGRPDISKFRDPFPFESAEKISGKSNVRARSPLSGRLPRSQLRRATPAIKPSGATPRSMSDFKTQHKFGTFGGAITFGRAGTFSDFAPRDPQRSARARQIGFGPSTRTGSQSSVRSPRRAILSTLTRRSTSFRQTSPLDSLSTSFASASS